MLEKISVKLADILVQKNAVKEEEEDVYVYGIMLSLSTYLGMLSIILISAVFFEWYLGILFLAVYTPIRVYCGGYHCNTYLSCFVVTNIIFILNVGFIKFLLHMPMVEFTVLSGIALALSWIYILLKAPVLNSENPLSKKRIAKNRRKSVVSATALLVIAVVLRVLFIQNDFLKQCYCIITSSELTVSVLMIIQKIKERRKNNG